MTVTPLPRLASDSSDRWGIMAMHGPHQVAQNSTTYTLPGSNALTASPWSHSVAFSAGARSPTLKVISGFGWAEAPAAFRGGAWGLPFWSADLSPLESSARAVAVQIRSSNQGAFRNMWSPFPREHPVNTAFFPTQILVKP